MPAPTRRLRAVLVALSMVLATAPGRLQPLRQEGRRPADRRLDHEPVGAHGGGAAAQAGGLEDVKVHAEAVNGTGLLTPRLYDWQDKAKELIDTYRPKIVVVLFVGNYTDTDLFTGADGQPIANDYGLPFYAEWGRQADKLTTTLQSRGARVYWVLPPPFLSDEGARRNTLMRQTYIDLAKARPGVGLVDGRQALGGPQGEYEWKLPGADGKPVTVRQGDSLHLTEEGGDLMARKISFDIGPPLLEIRRAQATT